MITWAQAEWMPQLKQIWLESFGDKQEWIDLFFTKRFRTEDTLVWVENYKPAAMAFLLPAFCWKSHGKGYVKRPVRYLYAVATQKEYQGRGISSQLISYIHRYLKETGQTGLLIPGDEGLIHFYEKRGFFPSYRMRQKEISLDADSREKDAFLTAAQIGTSLMVNEAISAASYKRIRDRYFGRENYIEWEENAIFCAIQENAIYGGFTHEIILGKKKGILMGAVKGDTLLIKESTLTEEELKAYAAQLAGNDTITNIKKAGVFLMSTSPEWKEGGYFNLGLD